MDQAASPSLQPQAARALAHYRNELRIHLRRLNRRIVVPQPVYPFETFTEESDETIETDADSAATSDTSDASIFDSENDISMADEANTQPGHNMPAEYSSQRSMDAQSHIGYFESVHDTAEIMDLSEMTENVQGEDGDSNEETDDEFLYPDPEPSEIIPPPTQRLPRIDLHFSFMNNSNTDGMVNELPEALMGDCEGDLSNSTYLMLAQTESPLLSSEVYLRTMNGSVDETADLALSMELDISENAPSKTLYLTTQNSEIRNSSEIFRHVGQQSALSQTLLTANSSALEATVPRKEHTPSAPEIPGLGLVAVHVNSLIGSSITDSTYEQATAAEPANSHSRSIAAEQEELPAHVRKRGMEEMEAEILADAEAKRKLLCRAHKMLASEHYRFWLPRWAAKERLDYNNIARSVDGKRSPTMEDIREIQNVRSKAAAWKRHAVWARSLLCVETTLQPLPDPSGEYITRRFFHVGRGPTGGDPHSEFWRHCD